MKIKVCGMKHPENIEAVLRTKPDYMGFIFYEKSPRYVSANLSVSLKKLDENIQTVGVFVNSPIEEVVQIVRRYELDFVQLHGNESIAYTKELSNQHFNIIKAFQISENVDWENIKQYAPYVTYNLFDTATKNYGGSGLKFSWELLKTYVGKTPFFLSGGISIEDAYDILKLNIPQLYAIDINSKFERSPGFKDVELVKEMINKIRNERIISRKQ